MYYKLAQLILTPSQKTGTIGEVYVAQPDSNHEKIAGRLFIVIEMPASTPGGIKFINFLINDFTHNYYQNEKLILRERLSTVKIEHIFEAALAKTNKNIADFLHTPSISLNLKTLSATVGVIFESELHFAIIGHNKAFLVYPNPKSETGKDYRITEITQRLNSDEPPPSTSHTKMFSNVINGQIPPSGYFMFCNETLPEYLSNKQLTEIVTTLSPAAAIEQMKNLLGQVNAYVSFFALLIKNTLGQAVPTDRPVVTTIIPQSSQASINQLKSTESTTEHYLAPSGTVDIRSWFAKIISFWPSLNLRRGEAPTGTGQMMMTERVTFRKQTAFRWLHRLGKILHSLVEKFLTLLFLLPRLFRPGLWRVGFGRVATALVEFPKKLIALKRSHQIAIVIGIISIALLSYNLVNQNSKNQVKAKELLWQTLSQSIEQKENQADANLLYGNDFGTNQLLVEIKPLLDQLPAGDARFTTLFNRYNEQAAKARHETRIAATQLTDWNQLAAGSAKPTRLYYYKNNIYGLDGAQKSIYQYDITGKTNSRITLDSASGQAISLSGADENRFIFIDGNAVTIFSGQTQKSQVGQISLIPQASSTDGFGAMMYYNNRVYAINLKDQQIYRYNPVGKNFGVGTAWLNQAAPELSQAADLAIASSIYALTPQCQVYRYLKGQAEPLTIGQVMPACSAAKRILITDKSIYILEPSSKRLIAFGLDGKLQKQYIFENLDAIGDIWLDAKTNTAYLLNGSSVWQAKL